MKKLLSTSHQMYNSTLKPYISFNYFCLISVQYNLHDLYIQYVPFNQLFHLNQNTKLAGS